MHQEAHQNLTLEYRYASLEGIIGLNLRELSLEEKVTKDLHPEEQQPVRVGLMQIYYGIY
ncbi:hypothetical protein KQI21_07795 [Virgibacillus proomii]|nr:hypothetical protein [Virgibacillus proomii]